MRTAVLLLLVCTVLVGCFRPQTVESEINKALPTGGRLPGMNTGDGPQHQALTSTSDVTPEELVEILKQKGVDVGLSPVPGSDRYGAVASLLIVREPNVSEPARVLVYFCANEAIASELVGLMGDDAFTSGRFAIGPSIRNPDNQALARKIRKALD